MALEAALTKERPSMGIATEDQYPNIRPYKAHNRWPRGPALTPNSGDDFMVERGVIHSPASRKKSNRRIQVSFHSGERASRSASTWKVSSQAEHTHCDTPQ